MPRKNTPDAKSRILTAALNVFAEKSFDGARVDDISVEANVPKSLIYYHFKSKAEIFDTLVNNFLQEFSDTVKNPGKASDAIISGNITEQLRGPLFAFASQNADLIRLLLIESLKKKNKRPAVYRIAELMAGNEGADRAERLIAEFFTSILPNMALLCYFDTFAEYFGIDKKAFGRMYTEIMQTTHGAYHAKKENLNKDGADGYAENK